MSILIETTLGDLVFDLYTDERPRSTLNFLKLCKIKYYNYCLFHSVRRNFIAQSGDPTGTGRGGESIYSLLYGTQAKYFDLETKPRIKHKTKGTISFVNNGNDKHGSQFFITMGEALDFLDGKHTIFGALAEGFDTLEAINETICDENHKPFRDLRITHTIILYDPFEDPAGLTIPDQSPDPTEEQLESGRIAADEEIEEKGKSKEEVQKEIEEKELQIGTKILETVGDIKQDDEKPPENVLFVCKLNPITKAEDLKIIFSRFGKIASCEIIKDHKTGESLCYGFVEFKEVEACEKAYFKMDNVLIDDRRIHVDFCQTIGKNKKTIVKQGGLPMKLGKDVSRPVNKELELKDRGIKKDKEKYSMVFDEDEGAEQTKVKPVKKELKEKSKKKEESESEDERTVYKKSSEKKHKAISKEVSKKRRSPSESDSEEESSPEVKKKKKSESTLRDKSAAKKRYKKEKPVESESDSEDEESMAKKKKKKIEMKKHGDEGGKKIRKEKKHKPSDDSDSDEEEKTNKAKSRRKKSESDSDEPETKPKKKVKKEKVSEKKKKKKYESEEDTPIKHSKSSKQKGLKKKTKNKVKSKPNSDSDDSDDEPERKERKKKKVQDPSSSDSSEEDRKKLTKNKSSRYQDSSDEDRKKKNKKKVMVKKKVRKRNDTSDSDSSDD